MKSVLTLILVCASASARQFKHDRRDIATIERSLESFPSAPGPHPFEIDWKSVKNIWTSPALKPTVKNFAMNVDDKTAYPNLGDRIVGGNIASTGQFPHHTLVILSDLIASYWCGGSLVNIYWVLSAAHCTAGMTSINVYSTVDINQGYLWTSHAASYVTHGSYDPIDHNNDITMIRLGIPISITPNINLVNLPNNNLSNSFAGYTATTPGFGRYSDASQNVSTQLRYVTNPVMTHSDCNSVWGILPAHVCLHTAGGRGACNGDSGGGAAIQDSHGVQVIGIVSYGWTAGCQLGYPVVYTRVTSFITWIQNVISNY